MIKLENVSISCQPVGLGTIFAGGWNWYHPICAHVKGTAGNLDRWALGYKHTYCPLNGEAAEVTLEWETSFASIEEAYEWLNGDRY